jgi:hypothetical protein
MCIIGYACQHADKTSHGRSPEYVDVKEYVEYIGPDTKTRFGSTGFLVILRRDIWNCC